MAYDASLFATPSSSSAFLASTVFHPRGELTPQQIEFINISVVTVRRNPLAMLHNLSASEIRRMRNEMENSPIGTIAEAQPSLADCLTGATRRYFWKKTPEGILQLNTNADVTICYGVFSPF